MQELKAIKLVYKDGTEKEIQNKEHIIIARYNDDKGFYSQHVPTPKDFCNLVANILEQNINQNNKEIKEYILSLMLVVLSKLR